MNFPAILSIYNSMPACICRRFNTDYNFSSCLSRFKNLLNERDIVMFASAVSVYQKHTL